MSMNIVCAIFNSFASKKLLVWTSLCFNHVDKDKPRRGQHKRTVLSSQVGQLLYERVSLCFSEATVCPGLCAFALSGAATLACVAVEGGGSRGASAPEELPANFRQWQPVETLSPSVFRTAS